MFFNFNCSINEQQNNFSLESLMEQDALFNKELIDNVLLEISLEILEKYFKKLVSGGDMLAIEKIIIKHAELDKNVIYGILDKARDYYSK